MPNLMQIRICSHISVEIQIRNFMKIKSMCAACSVQIKEGRKEGRTNEGRKEGRKAVQTVRYDEHNSHFPHLVNATKTVHYITYECHQHEYQ